MRKNKNIYKIVCSFLFFYTVLFQSAQGQQKTRVLLVLDASGSMLDTWGGETKFSKATKILTNYIDSMQGSSANIEFALRIYGHQSPRSEHNCQDSKLEVPFSKINRQKIKETLDGVKPQGWTPIAYSLYNATLDFPQEGGIKNAIVLITDGLESCDGDPCAVAAQLKKQRIVMKPFIIGMGMEGNKMDYFDCIGTFYDASNPEKFKKVLNIVISQALNNTTAQVNLLDIYDKPTETNVAMTFYNHYTGEILYDFMHTLDASKKPTLLNIDPVGKYDLVVHTIPSVSKKGIELNPGKHNIIAIPTPQGELSVHFSDLSTGNTSGQYIIRKQGAKETLHVQDINSNNKFIVGKYDIEVLTIPRKQYNSIEIKQGETYSLSIPREGTFSISAYKSYEASLYQYKNKEIRKIYEYHNLFGEEKLKLLPGNYKFVFRNNDNKQSHSTQELEIQIYSGRETHIDL